MHSKTIVITGASTGIGRACALHLDKLGFQVIAGVRTETDATSLQQASSDRLTTLHIDIAESDSILRATNIIETQLKSVGLYGLINNAGIVIAGPLEFVPIDALRSQLEINVVGHIAMTQALLPLLRQAKGRIINMSSVSGRVATPFLGPYAASKFALEALSDSLRIELHGTGVALSVIQPGPIITAFRQNAIDQFQSLVSENESRFGEFFAHELQRRSNSIKTPGIMNKSPEAVGKKVVHALESWRPRRRYCVTPSAYAGALARRVLPYAVVDAILRRRVTRLARATAMNPASSPTG